MTINKTQVKEDLYLAVNSEAIEKMEIPEDRPAAGGFMELHDENEKLLREDFVEMRAGKIDLETPEQEAMIAFYNLALDFERRDREGAEPVMPYVEKIEAISSIKDLEALTEEWNSKGLPFLFAVGVAPDMKNAEIHSLYADVPSIILPDKTYYDGEMAEPLLGVYTQMSSDVLQVAGFPEEKVQKLVADTLALDRKIVPFVKTAEEKADYTKMYNPRSLEEVNAYHDEFSFADVLQKIVSSELDKVIITQPIYFESLKEVINEENLELIKSWLIVKLVNHATPYLSEELRQKGSLFQKQLTGIPEIEDKEKHAFSVTRGLYDQVVGLYYGEKYFGEEAKVDVEDMVKTMIQVYQERLQANDWLSSETIEKAIRKLDTLEPLIGFPEDYIDVYKQQSVNPEESFYAHVLRFTALRSEDNYERLPKKVDRKEWLMSADQVNAYYNPTANGLCFPAGILQKPFYSIDQSRSANYGGIGAVIAHEISHAFDNNGAKLDEKGNLNNWWTEGDFAAFDKKAEEMVELWDGLEIHGAKVNGKLTVSENIADAGGLTCALEALKKEEEQDFEEFFYNWARVWCQKGRDEYLQLLLNVDVHGPNPLRANMPVRSLPEFYETFEVKEGDRMYLPEDERVTIW